MAGSVDGTVRCFDLRAGACYADELGHPVASMALSHDGNCLLAACLDSRVRLLDREGGELLATYQGEILVVVVVVVVVMMHVLQDPPLPASPSFYTLPAFTTLEWGCTVGLCCGKSMLGMVMEVVPCAISPDHGH